MSNENLVRGAKIMVFFKRSSGKIGKHVFLNAHQIENCLEILLGTDIFEKCHFQPELRTIKVWSQIVALLCYVFTPICNFFWLSLFSLPVCTFFGHFLSNPPSKIRPGGTLAQQGYGIAQHFQGGYKNVLWLNAARIQKEVF